MLGSHSSLKVNVGDRTYLFFFDAQSPAGEIHDALCQMKGFVVEKINEAHQAETKNSKIEKFEPVDGE